MKTYKLLLTLGTAMFALSYSLHAQADNDDLAFDFVSAEENQTVKRCYEFGDIDNYTYNKTKYWPTEEVYSCEVADDIAEEIFRIASVDRCVSLGIYTFVMGDKVKNNELLNKYNQSDFYNIEDFCQQIYDELYPWEYRTNQIIRGIVK